MKDSLYRVLWKAIPTRGVSRITGAFAKHPISKKVIPSYINHFQIELEPVKKPLDQFDSLLDFFVRELKPEARPIDTNLDQVVSPVDGAVSQIGVIQEGSCVYAKGEEYSLAELLGNDPQYVEKFQGGKFVTLYLSPRDYHRIHMPVEGDIEGYTYLPGPLYPVNPLGMRLFPELFAVNERLVTYVRSSAGLVAVVKVGATNVGSIKVTYDEVSTNKGHRENKQVRYREEPHLSKGDELGRFEFGSTVILLFEPNRIEWTIPEEIGTPVTMGKSIAKIVE
ncbi:phosphatidylserine decarboxylase [Thermoactinomyces sp. DSM 45891]|uniref:archaetidylserine decarboxylase n=1 Tax=Thermoactinomyces sp. DSM 45891 TaxID=1761907 RepID=UPI0009118E83|nr:archaetidylserine decarboxylase [Thermoactinomyces sp. DSM 45891]SFX45718.1 phosphatidylserine decarboxylase [Thermoactinomyces sp. DSM 45891]